MYHVLSISCLKLITMDFKKDPYRLLYMYKGVHGAPCWFEGRCLLLDRANVT